MLRGVDAASGVLYHSCELLGVSKPAGPPVLRFACLSLDFLRTIRRFSCALAAALPADQPQPCPTRDVCHPSLVTRTNLNLSLRPNDRGRRPVVLARELTKLHEEIFRGTLAEAAARYGGGGAVENGGDGDGDPDRGVGPGNSTREPRGEFTVVLGPRAAVSEEDGGVEGAARALAALEARWVTNGVFASLGKDGAGDSQEVVYVWARWTPPDETGRKNSSPCMIASMVSNGLT